MKRLTLAYALGALTLAIGLTSTLSAASAADAEQIAGYDQFAFDAPHRAGKVGASVWYPVGTKTYKGNIGENPLFEGTPAYVGAEVADGRFPVVLLSHGSGGNMDGLSWLSSALAARGAMVLAVNHPGSTTGDSSPRRSVKLDERAADLSVALDRLLETPVFADHIDRERIDALGFSLGGATALGLGGLRFDRELWGQYCDRLGPDAADCVFFAKGGIDYSDLPDGFEAAMRDDRVSSVVAVDPGLSYAVTADSAAKTDVPVLFVSLGRENLWPAADVSETGSGLVGRIADATHVTLSPAHHFTFLQVCKPDGAKMLREENDDPICDDPAGTDRAKIHAEIVDEVAAWLGLGNRTN
ncbi:alpha/beta hydrolase family protein [Microbaculum sp. FT89]|uniref:alpha/beta hydrolase family protein n=1 Tax=Microbaculum sp. FT89 TaxID=3447298 RepID=UPI003F52D678